MTDTELLNLFESMEDYNENIHDNKMSDEELRKLFESMEDYNALCLDIRAIHAKITPEMRRRMFLLNNPRK